MSNLGKNIRNLRMKNRLSQAALADLINIPSQSKISSWESDQSLPNIVEAKKLSQVLGISIEDLLSNNFQ
ncbi:MULTISPECIES: helix-turn-helix transcriptional regulator [unclassified Arcicella]|uniref:helix-turn-helix transcriptional regulator n=1 Tax=unclassified Arcicella TaxID=2644986 RepID=UPI0028661522|nr:MULTISPECIES: helix-turn-helix transcriptional regulator [unclassified Arcicella]MDR6563620.1 transcriptional regulator with XRE-family HTH domain [Arcicella sp. BE51]MDR6814242.1 transcriptional regulator with XRE-family HTH domain [Arcicella sp. BE140]MDR6825519.1 transcriptional regulator with XRE-family HTH domain [Arcicella sp. BE139]